MGKKMLRFLLTLCLLLLSFTFAEAQTETDSAPPTAETTPTDPQNVSPASSAPNTAASKNNLESKTPSALKRTKKDKPQRNVNTKRPSASPSPLKKKSSLQNRKRKTPPRRPKSTEKIYKSKRSSEKSNKNKERAQRRKKAPLGPPRQVLKKKEEPRPIRDIKDRRKESFAAEQEGQGTIIRSSSNRGGLIEYMPNFEKEFLPGYHDIIESWKTSLPHENTKGGLFSSAEDKDSEKQNAKESIKETLQKKWDENSPSKRTLINLAILVVLALGLLFYRIRGGYLSR